MPETEIKAFRMKKVIPNDLIFVVHPFSNPQLSKTIRLTNRNPYQVLPLDWALGIFMDDGNYNLYKKGYITFENNDAFVRAAYEAGAYFDDKLDFTPAKADNEKVILSILVSGNRSKIMDAMKEYGDNLVKQVAITHRDELNTGVVNMLENLLKIQLFIDGGDFEGDAE